MKKLLIILMTVAILALSLTACSQPSTTPSQTTPSQTTPSQTTPSQTTPSQATPSEPATSTPAPTPTTDVKAGGTLEMMITADPSTFYPPKMTGQTDGQSSSVCLETLFHFDAKLSLVPLLATGYTTDSAAKTITLSLREGVKFHDGSDFNAAVCKWNLDQFRAGTRPELKKVASVDVVDDYTVRLNLSEFDNTIVTNLGNISDAGRMISEQSFEANGEEWAARNPVGTGPFKFVSATKDVGITWTRNDDYWGGKPYLDGIEMKRFADYTVALIEFEAGNLHILGTATPRDAKSLQDEPDKYKVVVPPEGQVPALAGYALDENSPFSKLKVRQAMSYAIDVTSFVNSFGLGFWAQQDQWAVPGTWGYNDKIVDYPYNPEKAKQLLAEAGYPDGFDTTLSFFNTGQSIVDECTALQSFLQAVGINAELNPLQRPAFADMASNSKGWQGIARQQGFSSPDPLIKYAGVINGNEFTGTYVNDEMKNLYNQALTATDFETKQDLTRQLMAMCVDDYCIATYLCVQSSPVAKSTTVHDDGYGEAPYRYLSPMTWIDH
jgi:peptide/nickel transport system substrate-binding protein